MKRSHRPLIQGCSTGVVVQEISKPRLAAALPLRRRAADPAANARLTALTAIPLLVLLAAEGLTLLSLQSLVKWHVFLGMLLVPLVVLKVASTGYRFLGYYLRRPAYVAAGAPHPFLRLLGPVVVASTAGLFASGVALALLGPGPGWPVLLHKASFVVWVGAMSLHVLGHVVRIPGLAAPDLRARRPAHGSRLRLALVATAVASGAIVAVATLPLAAPWVHWMHSFAAG